MQDVKAGIRLYRLGRRSAHGFNLSLVIFSLVWIRECSMTRVTRFVLIAYCLLILYCCLWVPWHVVQSPGASEGSYQFRTGYGWLWSGPNLSNESEAQTYSTPDFPIIGLRLLASSALAGVAMLAVTRR